MPITAQRILTELGRRAWSGFNADDMIFDNDDSLQARAELNAALRYLVNLSDFPFRAKEQNIKTSVNKPNYSSVEGQISGIYNTNLCMYTPQYDTACIYIHDTVYSYRQPA